MQLEFPPRWKITTHWPVTPPVLSDTCILECFERPVGQPRIRDLCRGKSRPLVLVDDLNRPTPVGRILPFLLKEFEAAGIAPSDVTLLVARGSHGEPQVESLQRKVGKEAASSCRVLLHDPYHHTTKVGKTTLGTPVYVNEEVLKADFVTGIGGIYPNNTAGFGGGAKLALGALDIRVISQLHRKHKAVGSGAYCPKSDFRRDLDEIAQMIGLNSLITAHVNADRELVRIRCGDYRLYYEEEVNFVRKTFRAPKPGTADVVISNAFPNDLSLTFIHMKGVYPLRHAAPPASRIVIGACSEGEGFHGVYPIVRMPPFHEQRDRLRRISLMTADEIARKIAGKIAGKFHQSAHNETGSKEDPQKSSLHASIKPSNPIWLYRTGKHDEMLPSPVRGINTRCDWKQILEIVRKEQGGRDDLDVVVYPCAPLQVIE